MKNYYFKIIYFLIAECVINICVLLAKRRSRKSKLVYDKIKYVNFPWFIDLEMKYLSITYRNIGVDNVCIVLPGCDGKVQNLDLFRLYFDHTYCVNCLSIACGKPIENEVKWFTNPYMNFSLQ